MYNAKHITVVAQLASMVPGTEGVLTNMVIDINLIIFLNVIYQ